MNGKHDKHGKIVGIALLFAMMMVLSAFTAPATASETRQDDSQLILRVAMQDDIKGLNPITVSDVWSWNVLAYIYDGPINMNPTTDELIPYLAVGSANTSTTLDSVDWSDCDIGTFGYTPRTTWNNPNQGGTNDIGEAIIFYDFTNVTWHDGIQMDIHDVLFSMHMAAMVPEWSASMNPLKDQGGKGSSNYSLTSWLHVYNVYESADHMQAALKFVLQEPYADFMRSTVSTFLLPYHVWGTTVSGQATDTTKIWCDDGYNVNGADAWKVTPATQYDNNPPIGNGPFKFVLWEKGQFTKLETWRDHYFRDGYKYTPYVLDEYQESLAKQPNIDAVTYKIYKTAEAAVLALKQDDIDYIAWSVPPTFVQELANYPGIALQQNPEQGFFYLSYNMRKTSFGYKDGNPANGDVAKPLRKAIAHCIDKNRIVTRLLLNLGISGDGPVSSISPWYNESIPRYNFDPDAAKSILANAGYKVKQGSTFLTGQAAIDAAGDPNWWYNPDESPIGSSAGGLIEILTPEANYDPIRAQAGLMIAQQLRDIGIYAQSVAMDFGSIVDRIDNRDFDMYILGWSIGSDPTDFLWAFFHSSAIAVGQNYPGYQNYSFDTVIDRARQTGDEEERKKAVDDAQASICYDLPYDVLYYRTNIEAYRADRFTGWEAGSKGSIFTWTSLFNIRAPSPFKTNAQFVSPPSAIVSNSTDTSITVFVKDQDGEPLSGARVWLNASIGELGAEEGVTNSMGKFTTTFIAPYADPNDPEIAANGTQVIIQIKAAEYSAADGTEYDPAPSRLTLITVYPEGKDFLSVSLTADPDVIDPDIDTAGTLGFTYVTVSVTDQNGDPVSGSAVALSASPAVPTIAPAEMTTDSDGNAKFKLTATDLPENDNSVVEYVLEAIAIHPTDASITGKNAITLNIIDKQQGTGPTNTDGTPFPTFVVVISVFCVAAVSYAVVRRKK